MSLGACGGSSHPRSVPAAPTTTVAASTSTTAGAAPAAAAWVTFGHDSSRRGVDPTAPALGAVQPPWTSPKLDGAVYAQPLVVGSAVIVATEDDSVYALDAATGSIRWVRHLASPVAGSSLPCGNIDPSGITGTPVADPSAGIVWVVTFSRPYVHTLWGLDLDTGAVASSRPADPPGADARAEQQRGALALTGSMVYIPYGGLFGDCSDYHGWVVGLSVAHPADATPTTYKTPAAEAGIWAPAGPVVAADGSLLLTTGNGVPVGVDGQANSVLRLTPALAVQDFFTPSNFASLSAADQDLGSTAPALLPSGQVFQIGKAGVGYLLDGGHLGGLGGALTSTRICGGGFGGTAVDGTVVFVACFDGLYAVQVGSGPSLSVPWSATGSRPGPPIVAGGDVWVVESDGTLVARSETTGVVQYRHSIQVAGSFPSLAAADGRLFAADGDRVAAFDGV
jgi:outer membrane protein assembly factor BamB